MLARTPDETVMTMQVNAKLRSLENDMNEMR